MHAKRSEKGQILVLFVLGLVGLLSLTALAIDGSMVYSDRRFDQSVADSAALAGATAASEVVKGLSNQLFTCGNSDVITAMNNALYAAQTRAASNGFSGSLALASNLTSQHGVQVSCNDSANPKFLNIEVQVSSETATSFAHLFIGQDKIRNTVSSIVRVYPQTAAASGYAIVGLGNDCDTVLYNGDVDNSVHNGGVFSNGGITKKGASGSVTADKFGTVDSSCGPNGIAGHHEVLDGAKFTNQEPMSFDFPEIDCFAEGIPYVEMDKFTTSLAPGRHDGFKLSNKQELTLEPGLHCFTGNVDVTAKGKLLGAGVTLYFQEGNFDANGQGYIDISAPTIDTGNILDGMQGILIYIDPDNSANGKNKTKAVVDMQGTSDAIYSGTIYAPKGLIDFGGNSSSKSDLAPSYKTQFIGLSVRMHGNPAVTITYDESAFARQPASLDQYR